MGKVSDYMMQKPTDKSNIIGREQQTLDVMAGQVGTKVILKKDIDLSEAYGLDLRPVTDKEKLLILKKLGDNRNRYVEVYYVVNRKTSDAYWDAKVYHQGEDLLWHGSRNENWWGIMSQGLLLNPTNAVISGKMFGYGIYMADKSQKSAGYSSLRGSYWAGGNANFGLLALYKVRTGNQFHIKRHQSSHSRLNYGLLQKEGQYDSVFAHGGVDLRNNEFIIYKQEQCTIEYLVKLQ